MRADEQRTKKVVSHSLHYGKRARGGHSLKTSRFSGAKSTCRIFDFCTEGAMAKEAGGTSSARSLAHFTKLRDGEYGRGLVQHPVTIRANSYEVA